ncbi:hypothetical protein Zmor_014083 [Zophobas morio]|uniref:Uncharacterized protein n=1 Tax=Zophobas morio TaxID=2755281 RepID=A0AA38IE57_9CUCU|nr:hypothetical protein Zmor_014083 [Zophobas morio]
MISIEYHLKNELEKSVHKCLEDRMKTIEDRMKIFDKTIKNAATTGSCNVTSASRTIQPPIYDGQISWSSYKKQFVAAAKANSSEEEQETTVLVPLPLRGAVSDEDISKYIYIIVLEKSLYPIKLY